MVVTRRRAARRVARSAGPLRAGGPRGAAPGTRDGVRRREAVNSRAGGPPVTSGETDTDLKGQVPDCALKGPQNSSWKPSVDSFAATASSYALLPFPGSSLWLDLQVLESC